MDRYQNNSTLKFQFSGAFSIGKSKRPNYDNSFTPGPQHYNQESSDYTKKQPVPKWKINSQEREDRHINSSFKTPGPGSYNLDLDKFQGNKGITIKQRLGDKHNTEASSSNRAPNKQQQIFQQINYGNQEKSTSYSFASKYTIETAHEKLNVPGPGQYNIPQDFTNSILSPSNNNNNITQKSVNSISSIGTFGTSKKKNIYKNSESPGVGAYQVQDDTFQHFSKKPSFLQKSNFSKSKRFTHQEDKENNDNTKQKSKSQNFDTQVGPGSYQLKSTLNVNKNFTLGKRLDSNALINTKAKTPGPGLYVPVNPKNSHSQSAIIAKAGKEITQKPQEVPGPGFYYKSNENLEVIQHSDKNQKERHHFFGQSKRASYGQLQGNTLNTPGPGNYEIKQNFSSNKGAPIIKVDYLSNKWTKKQNTPGPLDYNINTNITKKYNGQIIIGQKTKDPSSYIDQDIPGVGNYNIDNLEEQKKAQNHNGPTFSKISNYQLPKSKHQEPGPGSYDVKSTIAGIPEYLQYDVSQSQQHKKNIKNLL